ncbi:MAG: hypothetical protein QXH96_01220 [Candidatus Geothermarchaeota archaeon]
MKLTNEELTLMNLFEGLTEVVPIVCKVYDEAVFYLVDKKDIPKLVTAVLESLVKKRSLNVSLKSKKTVISILAKELSKFVRKKIYIIFYENELEKFVRNFFNLLSTDSIQIKEGKNGTRTVLITVNPTRKGAVIGKGGLKIKAGKDIMGTLFNVEAIIVK